MTHYQKEEVKDAIVIGVTVLLGACCWAIGGAVILWAIVAVLR